MQTSAIILRPPNSLAVIQSRYIEDQRLREAMVQALKRWDEISKYTVPEDSELFQGTDFAGPGFTLERETELYMGTDFAGPGFKPELDGYYLA